MRFPSPHEPRWAARNAVTLVVIGVAHGILFWALLQSAGARVQPKAEPLLVTLVNRQKPALIPVNVAPPTITRPNLPTITPPEIVVQIEQPVLANTAPSASTAAPAPAVAASMEAPVAEAMPSMSEISYIRRPAPHYPPAARHAREEGLVILRVSIDENGQAREVTVYRSSGHARLDDAAKEAVAGALFKPYMAGGVTHAAIALVPIEFSLRS